VPANTTAVVTLPGAVTSIEVGSGEHSWTVLDRESTAVHPPLSLDSSLAQLIDDPEAYRIVLDAFDAHLPPAVVRDFRDHTRWTPGRYLREAINRTPLALRAQIKTQFAALNDRRAAAASA
jgi:alpha-L-rhamnosidase